MDLPNLLRVTGGVRIAFSALAMVGSVIQSLGLLRHAESAPPDAVAGLFARLAGALAFSGVGMFAGVSLREVAAKVEARRSYTSCQRTLVVFGMLSLCDCGWFLSAPVAVYALLRLRSMRGEFSESA